ncbi:casparian strip membrane protein 3, partial [Actinidia eriantha]|uniref:casparian strip membrane protein 3 n=1 Tax=Actinidia eriantha TaxID=165200 RepID=UPI0025832EA1
TEGCLQRTSLVLRAVAVVGTLVSAVTRGTTELPFSTLLKAEYSDLPTFTFFVIVNSVVCGYLVLSLPASIFQIVRRGAKISRVVFIFVDMVVYLAHEVNVSANWVAICQPFNNFCERVSGSLIGSFGGIIVFMLLILLPDIALSQC